MMANSIYQKLDDYWPIMDETSQISLLLDPRAKLSAFRTEDEKNRVKDLISNLTGYSTSISAIPRNDDIANTRNFFRQLQDNSNYDNVLSTLPRTNNIRDELTKYLALPLEDHIDPLLWWNVQQREYPILSQIARDYLCIQATSVASEQAFSVAGQTISSLRNRLEAETARATLCLKSWFREGIC